MDRTQPLGAQPSSPRKPGEFLAHGGAQRIYPVALLDHPLACHNRCHGVGPMDSHTGSVLKFLVVEAYMFDWLVCHDVKLLTDTAFLSSIRLAGSYSAGGGYFVPAYDLFVRDPLLER